MDDGSPDGTQDIVKQLQKVYGEDHIVSSSLLHPVVAHYASLLIPTYHLILLISLVDYSY